MAARRKPIWWCSDAVSVKVPERYRRYSSLISASLVAAISMATFGGAEPGEVVEAFGDLPLPARGEHVVDGDVDVVLAGVGQVGGCRGGGRWGASDGHLRRDNLGLKPQAQHDEALQGKE